VYNDGVAFRYILPKQFPLLELLIEDEATEFRFAYRADRPAQSSLPYTEQTSDGGWLGIFESRPAGFPPTSLVRNEANSMTSHLPDKPGDPGVAYVGVTPWTGPWRIVAIASSREGLATAEVVRSLH
jgi:hypothetical protein